MMINHCNANKKIHEERRKMKTKFKIVSWLVIALLLATALVGCGGGAAETEGGEEQPAEQPEKIVWKFGHLGNEDHIWNQTALKFAELVNEKTDGVIEVKVYPNEQLGNEMEVLNMIQSGTADVGISGESMQNWAPKAALMAVPYAFRDTEHMKSVIDSDLGGEISAQIAEKVGVKPIYYHLRAPRNLTTNEPVRTPEDVKGLKMRVPNVPLFVDAWKAVGAQPQVMAFSEVFTGLQQGVIGAQENPYDLIYSAGFYEVQKYVNETEHVNGWVYVVLGQSQFDALTDDLKAAVTEAAAETQAFADQLFYDEIAGYKQKVQDEGMTIVDDVDKAAFQKAMEPAVKESLDEEQFDLYQRILEFK